jgi:triacylglycerol esterase/lipase EstA (alpha/beta hydrolase family)
MNNVVRRSHVSCRFSWRFTWSRILVGLALVAVLAAATLYLGAPSARARFATSSYVSSSSYPILFVHGINASSSINCGSSTMWGTMISYLQGTHTFNGQPLHWSGAMKTIGFYNNDTNCSVRLTDSTYASHCTAYFYDASVQGTNNENIRHVACEFAWYVYLTYSQYGQNVQGVGHSMGGLILQWAIYGVHAHLSSFPPSILMQDVVTIAAPHNGTVSISTIVSCNNCIQASQMVTGSSFINDLVNLAQNPQGSGWGTDWTMIGGRIVTCDVISSKSSTYMNLGHKSYFTWPCYTHGAYLTDTNDAGDADIYWCDGCATVPSTWKFWGDAPHSLRHTLYALYVSNW